MKKLKEDRLNKIISLRKKGLSYKELSKKFKVSKSTAYKYSCNITLATEARRIITNKIIENQQTFVKNYAKLKELPIKVNWCVEKARLISHCLFDGSVTQGTINYTNSSKNLINLFIRDVHSIYGINPTRVYTKKGKNLDKITVYFCSKALCKDLLKYTPSYSTSSLDSKVPDTIFNSSKEEIREFLRAFWEDEGCVTIKGEILGRIKSKKIRNQLIFLHGQLGINCRGYDCSDGAFGIRILLNKENLNNFLNIGFKDSIIIRGFNVGMLKKELLNQFITKR